MLSSSKHPGDDRILSALRQNFQEFHQAFDDGALAPKDFVHYGASIHTLDQFISAYHKVLETVRKEIFLQG